MANTVNGAASSTRIPARNAATICCPSGEASAWRHIGHCAKTGPVHEITAPARIADDCGVATNHLALDMLWMRTASGAISTYKIVPVPISEDAQDRQAHVHVARDSAADAVELVRAVERGRPQSHLGVPPNDSCDHQSRAGSDATGWRIRGDELNPYGMFSPRRPRVLTCARVNGATTNVVSCVLPSCLRWTKQSSERVSRGCSSPQASGWVYSIDWSRRRVDCDAPRLSCDVIRHT